MMWACLSLFGYLITAMDWCLCCGIESYCEPNYRSSLQSWLDQATEERLTANSNRNLTTFKAQISERLLLCCVSCWRLRFLPEFCLPAVPVAAVHRLRLYPLECRRLRMLLRSSIQVRLPSHQIQVVATHADGRGRTRSRGMSCRMLGVSVDCLCGGGDSMDCKLIQL